MNGAVPGYGTDQELLVLERLEADDRPAAVVIVFSVSNDVWNNYWPLESRFPTRGKPHFDIGGSGQFELVAGPPLGLMEHLTGVLGRSVLVTVIRTGIFDHLASAGARQEQLRVLEEPGGQWAEAWSTTEWIIARVGAWSRVRAVPVLLVINPDPCQVQGTYCAGRDELAASNLPQRVIGAMSEANGISSLDLLPSFRAAADRALYRPRDIHWDEAGHTLAADAITRALPAVLHDQHC